LPDVVDYPPFNVVTSETVRYRDRRPEMVKERVDGFKAMMMNDIARLPKIQKDRRGSTIEWMKHFLRADCVLAAFNSSLNSDELLREVDIKNCPAVHLWSEAWLKRLKAGYPPKDNDVDDWFTLPIAAYADVMLTERHLRELILQGNHEFEASVTASADEAYAMLSRLIGV
jgi:hypothetical protein